MSAGVVGAEINGGFVSLSRSLCPRPLLGVEGEEKGGEGRVGGGEEGGGERWREGEASGGSCLATSKGGGAWRIQNRESPDQGW